MYQFFLLIFGFATLFLLVFLFSCGLYEGLFNFLNFIYFKTITKQVIQLILIMLVGTDVCVPVVSVWEETGVPG